jgi:hypothetical protein
MDPITSSLREETSWAKRVSKLWPLSVRSGSLSYWDSDLDTSSVCSTKKYLKTFMMTAPISTERCSLTTKRGRSVTNSPHRLKKCL